LTLDINVDSFSDRLRRYQHYFYGVAFPTYNLTGNHDVGYSAQLASPIYRRWTKAFGSSNHLLTIADHYVLLVDAQSLEPTLDPVFHIETWRFLNKSLATIAERSLPGILITKTSYLNAAYSSSQARTHARLLR
jgi:hypothetical protein